MRPATRCIVTASLLAAAVVVVVAACGRPTEEDRRRIDILANDPMLDLDLPQLTSEGPVTTVVGHGEGPTLTRGEAKRNYASSNSPSEIVDTLADAAKAAGWEIQRTRNWRDQYYVVASRTGDEFSQGLDIHIAASGEGSTVQVVTSAGAAAGEGAR